MTSLQNIVLIALYGTLALAALMDVWKLRISNLFPAAVILLFPAWMYACGWGGGQWQNAIVFIATFLGGLTLFSRGWLGGGDVKLLAAIALWFDFKGAAALFLWIGLGGAALAIVFILLRRLLPAAIFIPLVLGALLFSSEKHGFFAMESGISLFAFANIVLFTVVIRLSILR